MEKTLESPLDCKEIQPVHPKGVLGVHWKDWHCSWNSNTLATWCEELTHWKSPWCWEGLGAGGEEDDRGLDGWVASLTRWTRVWVNSRSRWWTGSPGVLRFMGRKESDMTEQLNWTEDIQLLKLKYTITVHLQLIWKEILSGTSRTDLWAKLSPCTTKLWFWIQTQCASVSLIVYLTKPLHHKV